MKARYLFLTFLIVILTRACAESEAQNKPNIILLMAEDISLDLECYGMESVKTPVLNNLADGGIKFTNCISSNPICSPNRSGMMVGVYQHKINAQHHRSNRDVPLAVPYKPFTWYLRNAGYTTILGNSLVMGKGRKTDCNFLYTPLGEWDGTSSFGLFDKYDNHDVDDQPFFAQIQFKVTHRGDWWDNIRNQSSQPVDPGMVVLPPYLSDHTVIRLDWATYLDQIEYMDNEIGLLISDLKQKGMYENTVIIFVGDNGRSNLRGKGYLYDEGLNVPLIVRWPDVIKPGEVKQDLVSTIDIPATILDIAGIEIPFWMDGKSFLDVNFKRDYVFSARDCWDEIPDKARSITTQKFKYIRNDMPELPYDAHQAYLEFHRPALHVMRKLDLEEKLTKDQKLFFSLVKPKEELYDRQIDPYELNNLALCLEYSETIDKMRDILSKEEKALETEIIYHPIPPISVKVLEWVMYMHQEDYMELLQGKHIGYEKYVQLMKNRKNNKPH